MRTLAEVHAGIEATTAPGGVTGSAQSASGGTQGCVPARDFDSGVSREAICRMHDISYAALSSILHKNKRTAKSRIVNPVLHGRRDGISGH